MTKTDYINHSNDSKAKSATFVSGLPDLNRDRQHRSPLRILLSSRVRLTETQREELKVKWRKLRAAAEPKHQQLPGSTIKTVSPTQVEERLKTSQLIISDLINSRDSLSLSTVLELEKVFDIEIVSKEDFLKSAESYWEYVSSGASDG